MSLSPASSSTARMPSPPGAASNTPYGSDESSLTDLFSEYDYECDQDGNFVKIVKGTSKSPQSTPPTPLERFLVKNLSQDLPIGAPNLQDAPRRTSLSRSESLPLEPGANQRTLQRAISDFAGSAVTPAQSSRGLTQLSSNVKGTGRKGGPQRVTMQEAREIEERIRREEEAEKEQLRREQEEKENNADFNLRHSPPLSHMRPSISLPSHQAISGFPRSSANVNGSKHVSTLSRVSEYGSSNLPEKDDHDAAPSNAVRHWQSSNPPVLVKRSPVDTVSARNDLDSNALANVQPRYIPLPASRPSSSMGVTATNRARRVTYEENLRLDREIGLKTEYGNDLEDFESEYHRKNDDDQVPSISPTIGSSLHQRAQSKLSYSHQRQGSDTLRSVPSQPQLIPHSGNDYELRPLAIPPRLSPPAHGSATSLSTSNSGLAPRHRRSPTAPQPSTTSSTLVPNGYGAEPVGKTWAGNEDGKNPRDSKEGEEFEGQQIKASSSMKQANSNQNMQAQVGPDMKSRNIIVNKKVYARLDMIGKGGSSRVFRVVNSTNEIYAIKRVALDKTDDETLAGYMNEIALLRRLEGNKRIIRLMDSEVKAGAGSSKGHLMLVMECGEIDLAKLLLDQQKEPMNMVWISYYWQQILQAVQVIHDEKIVHSDLKPANFVLVKGQLKLIDFGIANAIANDTTNIQRDNQIGTINYMSPEAIELGDGMRRLKVGRPSDVWSLGCILYQMVYGHPPFHHLGIVQKMKAIPDPNHIIDFPDHAVPSVPSARNAQGVPLPLKKLEHLARPVREDVRKSMQKCLNRNAKERATIPELLDEDWLSMKESTLKEDETIINPHYMRQLLQYAIRCAQEGRYKMSEEEEIHEAERLVQELRSISLSS